MNHPTRPSIASFSQEGARKIVAFLDLWAKYFFGQEKGRVDGGEAKEIVVEERGLVEEGSASESGRLQHFDEEEVIQSGSTSDFDLGSSGEEGRDQLGPIEKARETEEVVARGLPSQLPFDYNVRHEGAMAVSTSCRSLVETRRGQEANIADLRSLLVPSSLLFSLLPLFLQPLLLLGPL